MCFSSKVCRSGVKGDVRVLPRLQSVRTQHRSVPEVYGVAGMPLSHRESQKHCAEWSAVHRGALLFLFMKSKSILYLLASYWIREPFFFFLNVFQTPALNVWCGCQQWVPYPKLSSFILQVNRTQRSTGKHVAKQWTNTNRWSDSLTHFKCLMAWTCGFIYSGVSL